MKPDYKMLFLRQSYLDATEEYEKILNTNQIGNAGVKTWDYVVLTASDSRQAAAFQAQIDCRLAESGAYFWIMTIKRTLSLLILCVAVFCFSSIYAIVIATVLFEIVGDLVTCIFNKKLLNCEIIELLKDTLPNLFITAIMFCVVYAISYIKISNYFLLVLQVVVGCLCVFLLARITRNRAYQSIIKYVKNRKRNAGKNIKEV